MSEEREALRAAVRRLLSDVGGTALTRERLGVPATGAADPAWKALASLGVCGVLADGGELADAAVVVGELGRIAAPLPYASSAIGAVSALLLAGDPLDLLPDLGEGTTVGTVAALEPGRRGLWREPSVVAEGGRLTGVKTAVADADGADVIIVSASDDQGLGLYAVRRDGGAAVEHLAGFDGTRPLATVTLDATPGTRLGDGDHTGVLETVVDRLLTALSVDGVAAARSAFDLAMAYTREREQFGRTIGGFQAVQHLCVEAFQALTLASTSAEAAVTGGHIEALTAAAWSTQHLPEVTGTAISVFAGIGFTWEHDVGLFHKHCLSLASAWGSAGDHLEALAEVVLTAG